ncbi:MAG: hypothetical protein AAFX79_01715 [Planctomycetota bacterium]
MTTIEAYAKTTGDEGVYARANIAPPKPAAPRTDPVQPGDLSTRLLTDGSIELKFKAATGGGATFTVERQTIAGDGTISGFAYAGQADDKTFVDNAIPAGLSTINYRVRTRLTNGEVSEWSQPAAVRFGSTGSGGGPLSIAA